LADLLLVYNKITVPLPQRLTKSFSFFLSQNNLPIQAHDGTHLHCHVSLMLVIGLGFVHAQSQTLTGKIGDAETGTPLLGVNVLTKGSTTGGITDASGSYSIRASDTNIHIAKIDRQCISVPSFK
jgi:hypothetical protein